MLLSVTDPLLSTGFRPGKFRTLFAEVASQHSQEFVCALSRQITEHIATNVDLVYRILEKCRRVKQVSTGAEGDNIEKISYEEIKSLAFQKLRLNLIAGKNPKKICYKQEEEIAIERFRVFVRNFLNIEKHTVHDKLFDFDEIGGIKNKYCKSPNGNVERELDPVEDAVQVSFTEDRVKKTVTIENKKRFVFNLADKVMNRLFVTSENTLQFNKRGFDDLFKLTKTGCQLKKRAFLKLWDKVTTKETFNGKGITALRWSFILSNIAFSVLSTPYFFKSEWVSSLAGVNTFIQAQLVFDLVISVVFYTQYKFSHDALVPSQKKNAGVGWLFFTTVKFLMVFVYAESILTQSYFFPVINILRSFSKQVIMMDGDLFSSNGLWVLGYSFVETLSSRLFYNQLLDYKNVQEGVFNSAVKISIATAKGDYRVLKEQVVDLLKDNGGWKELLKGASGVFNKLNTNLVDKEFIPGFSLLQELQKMSIQTRNQNDTNDNALSLGLVMRFKNTPNILSNTVQQLQKKIDDSRVFGVPRLVTNEQAFLEEVQTLQSQINTVMPSYYNNDYVDYFLSTVENGFWGFFDEVGARLSFLIQRGVGTLAKPLEPKSKPPIPNRFYYSVILLGLDYLQKEGSTNSLRDLIQGYSRRNSNFQPLSFTEMYEKQTNAFESVSSYDFFTKGLVSIGHVFPNVRYGDTSNLLKFFSSLSKIEEGSHTGVILKSLTMQGGYKFELDKSTDSAQFLSNITSESSIQEVLYEQNKTDVFLNRKDQIRNIFTLQNVSGTLFKVTRGKLFLRTQRGVDLHYGRKLRANALTVDIHGGGAHVSTIAKYHMEEKNILSINDLYQTDLGSIWFEHRFTQTGLKAKDFHLKLVYPQRGEAPAGVALRMDQAFFQGVVFDFLSPMDLVRIQYGMGPRLVPASTLFFKVLSQKRDASDLNYHMEKKYLTEIIPEARFLKTDLLDFTENPHDTPEYKGVEFLLSRPYCGNMKLVLGDKCYDMTCEIIRFLAAFLLYRKSSTFEEPKDATSFWDGEMDEVLENVFEAMKGEVGLDYDSYNSSSGVPVFGNGGVKIMPDELLPKGFCSTTSSVQTSTEAHVVSLLRGICARYAPGARQAAAY